MFDYVPEFFRAETADTEEEADAWYDDKKTNRRTPDLLPRDEVARAINAEVKAGRGSPHGGVFLDIASRRDAEYIKRGCRRCTTSSRSWPTSTSPRSRWRSGRPAHYMMGGVRVDAETHGDDGARPLRRRRGRGGHARRQPAGRQLALRPGGLRAARRPGTRREYASPGSLAGRRSTPADRGRSPRRCSRRSRATATRTRTPSTPTSKSACRTWSASSAPSRSWCRRWTRLAQAAGSASSRRHRRGEPPVQPGLAPGARPPLTCSPSPRPSPARRSSARRAAAATPATTSRQRTRPSAR